MSRILESFRATWKVVDHLRLGRRTQVTSSEDSNPWLRILPTLEITGWRNPVEAADGTGRSASLVVAL